MLEFNSRVVSSVISGEKSKVHWTDIEETPYVNIEEIQAQFNKVISYSQNIPAPKTETLFSDWYSAKSRWIQLWKGCTWEYPEPVAFELSPEEKLRRVDDFIATVSSTYYNEDLATFLEAQRQSFFDNRVSADWQTSDGTKIKKGTKLVKAFKYFENQPNTLNAIQMAASMIIQEDKVKGHLCLSVHPLDYLSSSENLAHWRSCHSLDGDYRAGNLSYMVDNTTIICYLKSDKDEILPNFPETVPWNSKKWRVLLFFADTEQMMFAGRQYPFSTTSGLDFLRKHVLPNAGLGEWGEWQNDKIKVYNDTKLVSPYVLVGDRLVAMDKLVVNGIGSLQFNDLLFSSCYDPVYSFKTYDAWWQRPNSCLTFKVGKACNCLRCGSDSIELSESMMCNNCELQYGESDNDLFGVCECCGGRYFYDEGYYVDDADERVCPSCAEEYVLSCCDCGSSCYKADMQYVEDANGYVCHWCADSREEEARLAEIPIE